MPRNASSASSSEMGRGQPSVPSRPERTKVTLSPSFRSRSATAAGPSTAQRRRGGEGQAQAVGVEADPLPLGARLDAVPDPCVVEGRTAAHPEPHRPADDRDAPDELVVPVAPDGLPHRHEVGDLRHAVGREEAGQEHVGVREVHLLPVHVLPGRGDLKPPALLVVEDRREDARRVEVAGSTSSRWTRCVRRGPPCAGRRSPRSPRWAGRAWGILFRVRVLGASDWEYSVLRSVLRAASERPCRGSFRQLDGEILCRMLNEPARLQGRDPQAERGEGASGALSRGRSRRATSLQEEVAALPSAIRPHGHTEHGAPAAFTMRSSPPRYEGPLRALGRDGLVLGEPYRENQCWSLTRRTFRAALRQSSS